MHFRHKSRQLTGAPAQTCAPRKPVRPSSVASFWSESLLFDRVKPRRSRLYQARPGHRTPTFLSSDPFTSLTSSLPSSRPDREDTDSRSAVGSAPHTPCIACHREWVLADLVSRPQHDRIRVCGGPPPSVLRSVVRSSRRRSAPFDRSAPSGRLEFDKATAVTPLPCAQHEVHLESAPWWDIAWYFQWRAPEFLKSGARAPTGYWAVGESACAPWTRLKFSGVRRVEIDARPHSGPRSSWYYSIHDLARALWGNLLLIAWRLPRIPRVSCALHFRRGVVGAAWRPMQGIKADPRSQTRGSPHAFSHKTQAWDSEKPPSTSSSVTPRRLCASS